MQVNPTESSTTEDIARYDPNVEESILSRDNHPHNSPEYAIQQQLRYNIDSNAGDAGSHGGVANGSRVGNADSDVAVVAAAAVAQSAASAPPASHHQVPTVGTARNYGTVPAVPVSKPAVGTEEYYKIKKDNHKEVERRRRETINKGIEELSKVVPDCDRHKGQILSRAVDYIRKLKEQEQQYVEKLTLEKLLSEQAISELTSTVKSLKAELQNAWKEVEHYKRQAGEQTK